MKPALFKINFCIRYNQRVHILDAKTLKKVKYYKKLLIAKQVKEIVGMTRVSLDGNSKCTENNLANLITDSYIRIVCIHNIGTVTYIHKVHKKKNLLV